MPANDGVRLKPNGKLEIIPIDAADDGLDPAWLSLPDQDKWDRVRRFMARGTEFERRFARRDVSLRVDRERCVFDGLPRSQAAYRAARDGRER